MQKKQTQNLDFFEVFPELRQLLMLFKENDTKAEQNIHQFLTDIILNQIDIILSKELNPYWEKLKSTYNGDVNKHIIRVLFIVYASTQFKDFNKQQKNTILWCCLLHDIVKRPYYEVDSFKDTFHPYLSACGVLDYFENKGFFNKDQKKLKNQLQNILKNSKYISYINGTKYELMCYKSLNQILQMIKLIFENDFSDTIFKITAFHQSLSVLKEYPNYSVLSPSQVQEIFSKEQLELLKLMMIKDSQSYIFDKQIIKNVEEEIICFFLNMNKLCQ